MQSEFINFIFEEEEKKRKLEHQRKPHRHLTRWTDAIHRIEFLFIFIFYFLPRTAEEDFAKVGLAVGVGGPLVLQLAVQGKEDNGERNVAHQGCRRA
jgi:hypothetical protein